MDKPHDEVPDASCRLPSVETAQNQGGHAKAYNFDVLKAYRLRVLNRLSYQEIADQLGEPKSSVYKALAQLVALTHDQERMEQYEEIRPALLSAAEERLLASLVDEEAIQKATLNNRAYAFQQLHTARRLEQGKSTSNQALSLLGQIVVRAEEKLGAPKAEPAPTPGRAPVGLAYGLTGSGFDASPAPSELDSTTSSSKT